MSDIKIIVATHKRYWMPKDGIYLPVHVGAGRNPDINGASSDLGYIRDDTGVNISEKNRTYCELTGLYWAWKNLRADYIGLAHYRRHFSLKRSGSKKNRVISKEELENVLHDVPIVLPKKRNYFIETNYSQYAHAHHAIDLDTTRDIIRERYPDYLDGFDAVMNKKTGHRFNMFIMRYDILDSYCSWLFDILFELENRLDISEYSDNDSRVFGFVGERLLDVWVETNMLDFREVPFVFMERQNWIMKGGSFLIRKLDLK